MDEPTPYTELNDVLRKLVDRVRAILGENFVGAYLQGSFAVGDFDLHSDVDFIVVVTDELETAHVRALTAMHEEVYHLPSEWAKHLEGSYFPRAIVREQRLPAELLWYLDHGSQELVRSDHCNTSIVRWVVRECGVTLSGPSPTTLIDPVPTGALRREMAATITDWGKDILADPDPYRNRFYQGFIVLNYCRMFHDLLMGRPSSKRTGAEWAKSHLDASWSPLIDRAWNGRPDPAVSVREPADTEDFEATLRFVESIIQKTAKHVAEGTSGSSTTTR